jgi:hypothetical protein
VQLPLSNVAKLGQVGHRTVTTASGTGHIFCAATSLQRGQPGVHKTVTTASVTGHIFCAVTSLQRGQA